VTRKECEQAVWKGWQLGRAGLSVEEFAAVLCIGKLNRRAVAAWERAENSGGDEPAYSRACETRDRACADAHELAMRYGWDLDTGCGLWWFLSVPQYSYDGSTPNALAHLQ